MGHAADLRALLERLERLFPQRPPLYLDAPLRKRFLRFSRGKPNTPKWVRTQRRLLEWWAKQLDGVNLRTASLADHIMPALDLESGSRAHRIAIIKRLYSWLRTERHVLVPAEDPTFGTLKVPQSEPAQWHTPRAVSQREYRRVRKKLPPHWRAGLDVLAATGWHLTELIRFVRSGSITHTRKGPVLTCPRTKRGPPLRTRIDKSALPAAQYLRSRGRFSDGRFYVALQRLRTKLRPGAMRHSVATHAIDVADETVAAVAAFLNHASERTLRRFYATHAIPRRIRTLASR